MNANSAGAGASNSHSRDNIAYIRQMLGELRSVAGQEGADMLVYLIEMAFVEAGDIQTGKRQLSLANAERHKTAGVPVQPSGKIQL